MATQFASLTPTVRFPAPHQSVRIAYSTQSSLGAIADALINQPTPVVEATLEELAIASQAQNVLETAHRLLSPAMYTAFLSWMEDAYRFASLRTGGDDEAFRLCDKHAGNGYRIAAMAPANEHDAAFQTYLYAIEASDCSCAGPLTNELGSEHLVGALIEPFLENVLDRSEVVTLLDTLAQQAWTFSATTSAFDVAIGEAIIRATKEAQAADTHIPRPATMPSTYSPFLRGAWLAWQKAYGRWIEAEREANGFYDRVLGPAERAYNKVRDQYPNCTGKADPEVQAAWAAVEYPNEWDARNHANWAAQHDAFVALITTPAPGPEELAIKLKLFRKEDAHNLVRAGVLIDCLLADARRFGRQGAYLQTDRGLLTAISDRTELEQHWPQQDSEAEWSEYAERVSAANERVITSPASTIEGTLNKLRLAFADSSIMCWSQLAMTNPADPAFRKGLAESGDADRMMWSAIEDLARIAGIDLGAPAAARPNSQHTAWLNERNDLLAAADRSEADVSDDEALSRINRLDARITDTPAATAEDVIAKLLMAVEVQAEGAEISTEQAAALVREAKAHLGIGYVYSAEVAA